MGTYTSSGQGVALAEAATTPLPSLPQEAARILALHGPGAYATIVSNLMIDEEVAGEIPSNFLFLRTSLLQHIRGVMAPLVGDVRMASADAEVREFAKDVLSAHLSFARAVKLCGAIAPTVRHAVPNI